MQYNFDPRGHKAYTRVKQITIDYGDDRIPVVRFVIQQAVLDGDGKVRHTDRVAMVKGPVTGVQLPMSIPAVNEATGEYIAGKSVDLPTLQLSLASYVRWVLDQENKPAVQPESTDSV